MRRTSPRLSRIVLATLCLALWLPLSALAIDPLAEGDHTFDSDGVELHYSVTGQGEPVVLLHGFTASIESNWRAVGVIDQLAEGFQVIALDQRGHGKSAKPHDPKAYGEAMVEDVIRLLDHLEIDKAHVVGYSMGGFITLKLVTMAPERLLSAVLGGAGWMPAGANDEMAETLASSLEKGEGIGPLLEALTPAGQTLSEEQKRFANQMVLANNDPLALAAVARSLGALAVPEDALAKIAVPMLAVVGTLDPLAVGVAALKGHLGDLDVVSIEGADHMTAISSPVLRESIFQFLVGLCKCA